MSSYFCELALARCCAQLGCAPGCHVVLHFGMHGICFAVSEVIAHSAEVSAGLPLQCCESQTVKTVRFP